MKKFSVQKTSLVLAALLTVAPMAATVTPAVAAETNTVSTAGSFKSDERQVDEKTEETLQKLKSGFISQQSIDDNSSLNFIAYMASNIKPVSSEKPAGIFDPEVPGSFAKKDAKVNDYFINSLFQKSSLPDLSEEDQGNVANIKFSLTVKTVSSSGETNVELNDSNKDEFEQSVRDMKKDPGSSLNLEYQFYTKDVNNPDSYQPLDSKYNITSKYVYQAPVFTKAVSANISSTTTPAQTGYSLSLYRNNLADDVRLYDAAGHEITSKVTGALSLVSDIKDSKGQTVTDSIFTQPGEYQQQATINFKSILGKDNYEAALQKGGITVFVDGSTTPLTLRANTTGFDSANGVYTYTRKINVTGDPINKPQENKKPVITDVAVNGIVTVKDSVNSSVAQLYDPNGNVIVDRALPARTSWITGQKRTINGVDYYQVSTEEYVKASQVYYKVKTEKSITVNVITGNIEYTKIPANVFRVTAGGFTSLWRVSNDGTSMIVKPDRFVPYHSDWKTAQIAVLDGQTFYQVSTNEWIRSENGNLIN